MAPATWVTFTRRTDDPKLAYLEGRLDDMGVPHRRNGHSFHAPIMEVPAEQHDAAYALLNEDVDGVRLDDIEDDDPMFGPPDPYDVYGTEEHEAILRSEEHA